MDTAPPTPLKETVLHAFTAALVLLATVDVLPTSVALALGAAASGWACSRALRRHRELRRRRESADVVLASAPGPRVPDRVTWRASELTSHYHRLRLAKQLRRLARMADETVLLTSVPVFLSTLRPNRDELELVAVLVGRLEQPVTPRGIVLLENLLGSAGSPLYGPGNAADLAYALSRVQGALRPSRSGMPVPSASEPARPGLPAQPGRA